VGAPLYRIEREPFEAALQQAQGALVKAQGQVTNAAGQLGRAETLMNKQVGSVAARDQRVAEEQTAKGDVLVAQANLQVAKINLAYTEIKAPISGLISRTSVTKGNVVGPDSGVLTTIVSQDPMYVAVPVSQREFLQLESEKRRTASAGLKVLLRFSDGTAYDSPGKINFIDVSVDKATDSVLVRATFPNPQGRLIDGQLVKVSVVGETPEEKILVPQAALIADQQGVYVFIVEDGKAAVRRLKVGAESGASVVVESGLEGGEQIVVEGMEALRPGAPVTASPATKTPGRS
jgi:membrane fusion protein (multidrug efflux system)